MLLAMTEAITSINFTVFDQFPEEEDVSFADWIAQKGFWDHPYLRAVCSQLSSSIVGREPHETGAHYFFDYVASGGGIDSLLTAGKDGAQSLMIKTGELFDPIRQGHRSQYIGC
jgi:monoamine oxidase